MAKLVVTVLVEFCDSFLLLILSYLLDMVQGHSQKIIFTEANYEYGLIEKNIISMSCRILLLI